MFETKETRVSPNKGLCTCRDRARQLGHVSRLYVRTTGEKDYRPVTRSYKWKIRDPLFPTTPSIAPLAAFATFGIPNEAFSIYILWIDFFSSFLSNFVASDWFSENWKVWCSRFSATVQYEKKFYHLSENKTSRQNRRHSAKRQTSL